MLRHGSLTSWFPESVVPWFLTFTCRWLLKLLHGTCVASRDCRSGSHLLLGPCLQHFASRKIRNTVLCLCRLSVNISSGTCCMMFTSQRCLVSSSQTKVSCLEGTNPHFLLALHDQDASLHLYSLPARSHGSAFSASTLLSYTAKFHSMPGMLFITRTSPKHFSGKVGPSTPHVFCPDARRLSPFPTPTIQETERCKSNFHGRMDRSSKQTDKCTLQTRSSQGYPDLQVQGRPYD